MTDRKIMPDRRLWAAAAAALLALAAAGAGFAQNPAPVSHEAQLRARDQAAADKAKALIEADRHHPRIGGMWLITAPETAIRTVDGKLPPMTAAAAKLYRQRIAERKAGKTDDPVESCLPPGTPRSLWSGQLIFIAQAPAKVTLFHQYKHLIRHVFLDGPPHLDDPDPNWEGHSSGWWDGDALKIETIGFNGEQWLDSAGLPQSPDMKVDETLHLLDADTLEDDVTITDPKYYAKPWTTKVTFKRHPDNAFMAEDNSCAERLLEVPLKPYAPSDGGTGLSER
jgi:hypothetical protein